MTKRALKIILRVVIMTYKTVSIKTCINRDSKCSRSQFSYAVIVMTINMKFLEVVTPPSVYHG